MKTLTAVAFGLLITCSLASAHDWQNQKPYFFNLLGGTRVDYRPLTTTEAIEVSDVIVRGPIVSISKGRSLYPNNGYSTPMDTLLIKMRVSKSLKGSYVVNDFFYLEHLLSGIPIEHLNKNKYKEEMLVLLRTPTWDKSSYTMVDSQEGLMHEVDTLYRLTNEKTIFIEEQSDIEGKTKISQPLDGSRPLFTAQSFEQLEEEIATLSTAD